MSWSGKPELAPVAGAQALRVVVIAAEWHTKIMDALLAGAERALKDSGVRDVTIVRVPGAFELPVAASRIAHGAVDAVVALGTVIRGGTPHFEYVCNAATNGLTEVAVRTGIPVGFGVLTCDTEQQALDRIGLPESSEDKGYAATQAALTTAVALSGYHRLAHHEHHRRRGITGVVLAAGAGRRMGRPKAELTVGARPLLGLAVDALLTGGCSDAVAVVRPGFVPAEPLPEPVGLLVNPEPDRGMAWSLKLALAAVTGQAAVIVLVDNYPLTAADVAAVIERYRSGSAVVVARRNGARSHPVVISPQFFEQVSERASGESGARRFLDSHPDTAFVDLPATLLDLDTPADLAAAELLPRPRTDADWARRYRLQSR